MKAAIVLLLGLFFLGNVFGQVALKNPNAFKAGADVKPRDAAVVASEKKEIKDCADAIDAYIKQNGPDKTIAEINKGKTGYFAQFFPKGTFYLGLEQMKSPTSATIVAHNNPAFIGFEIADLGMFLDNTNWAYDKELFAKGGTGDFEGTIDGIVWSDPDWQKGKKCRMYAYNKVKSYSINGKSYRYWTYLGIWLDQ